MSPVIDGVTGESIFATIGIGRRSCGCPNGYVGWKYRGSQVKGIFFAQGIVDGLEIGDVCSGYVEVGNVEISNGLVEEYGDRDDVGCSRTVDQKAWCGSEVASTVTPDGSNFFLREWAAKYANVVYSTIVFAYRTVIPSDSNFSCRAVEIESVNNGARTIMVYGNSFRYGIECGCDVCPFAQINSVPGGKPVCSGPDTHYSIADEETPIPSTVIGTEESSFTIGCSSVDLVRINPCGKGHAGGGCRILVGIEGDVDVLAVDVDGIAEFARDARNVCGKGGMAFATGRVAH